MVKMMLRGQPGTFLRSKVEIIIFAYFLEETQWRAGPQGVLRNMLLCRKTMERWSEGLHKAMAIAPLSFYPEACSCVERQWSGAQRTLRECSGALRGRSEDVQISSLQKSPRKRKSTAGLQFNSNIVANGATGGLQFNSTWPLTALAALVLLLPLRLRRFPGQSSPLRRSGHGARGEG